MTEAEYIELIDSYKALQSDYEHIGWQNTEIYARSCRALAVADKTKEATLAKLRAGENIQDVWKHQQSMSE
jgi:hypothetical protein